jgi:dihydroorotate dehydrogenase
VIYALARPLLFALDPEVAHHLTLEKLARAHALGVARWLQRSVPDDPVEIFGVHFRNPVGLAAGLDKNGAYIDALGDLGFGFIEAGTVTPKPQPGNPRPRLFRLPQAHALINRFGFNSDGLDAFVRNASASRTFAQAGGVIGINIGKNAATPIEQALDDYLICLRSVYPLLLTRPGYVTVNISSPNTRDLRSLQAEDQLSGLLRGVLDERRRLADQHGKRIPVAVKIAPDLVDADLPRIADTLVEQGVDAIIATNTTTARDRIVGLPNAAQAGGLSGAPLQARSTAVIAALSRHLQGRLPIIGVGGILGAEDALAKMAAGASLIQLYTGLIYRGPQLVYECRRALLTRADRATHLADSRLDRPMP